MDFFTFWKSIFFFVIFFGILIAIIFVPGLGIVKIKEFFKIKEDSFFDYALGYSLIFIIILLTILIFDSGFLYNLFF